MKLISMTCPHCGAKLQVDPNQKTATCKFCDTRFAVDDEVHHIQYDNVEDAGYQFEKGRQRAQREASINGKSNSYCPNCGSNNIVYKRESAGTRGYHKTTAICNDCGNTWTVATDLPQSRKKSKTWLWVLGWIFIFPVPLTILMLRNTKLDKRVRYGIIAAAWVIYFIIGLSGGKSNNTINNTKDSSTDAAGAQTAETQKSDPYSDLNSFIEQFNDISDIKIISHEEIDIHDNSAGHYRTEFRLPAFEDALAYSVNFDDGSSADLIDTCGSLSKETVNGNISRVYVTASSKESLESIFRTCCKIMHPDIADADIDEAIEEMMHPYKEEEMEYLYSSGSGWFGSDGYTYSIKEKESYYDFFLD